MHKGLKTKIITSVRQCTDSCRIIPVLSYTTSIWVYICKNKVVALTKKWLPELQTNWRDSDYERLLWY